MDTVKIYLDNDWSVMLKEIRHKTTKAVNAVIVKHNTTRDALIPQIQAIRDNPTTSLPAEIQAIIDDNTEAILLNQTIEWSFGDVTQETLDNIPTSKYLRLTQEVDKLYSQAPLVTNS